MAKEQAASKKAITKRSEDYSQWYLDIIEAADLAENSPVRGAMIIRPYGYAIWENIQKILDQMIKDTGHVNAYFPLLIPKSFLSREASHVKGFAKECAVVTHHRLKNNETNDAVIVDPDSKLEEELVIRPTSETIMYDAYSRWIRSWRDLPLLINQWANVMRWEMRTRAFLRTSEFLWQEGHTAHATCEEADAEALKMLGVYVDLVENYLAIPTITGQKSESEKFAGALRTYSFEPMMQDGKALQAGTSHNLGQNFAKAFGVQFTDKDGQLKYVWQTSWGVSTRLIGGIIMTHSDDKGLVLPPKIAPIQVIIIPIWKTEEEKKKIVEKAEEIHALLKGKNIAVQLDERDYLTAGEKFYEWEKKGVPIRLELGPKDLEKDQMVAVRRDQEGKECIPTAQIGTYIEETLVHIQQNLFERAKKFRDEKTYRTDSYDEFKKILEEKPGFIYAHWCGDADCEAAISEETKATTRCIPFDEPEEEGTCIRCGKPSHKRIIFAKAY
jgi:prolyl-tRNA synthetase